MDNPSEDKIKRLIQSMQTKPIKRPDAVYMSDACYQKNKPMLDAAGYTNVRRLTDEEIGE